MSTDKYANINKYEIYGGSLKIATSNIEIKSADASNGDIFRVATLPIIATIVKVEIGTTALTSATDNDLGFYKVNGGDVVDVDILADGQSLATASKSIDGLKDVSVANMNKTIKDLYKAVNSTGTALNNEKYVDVALTINTAPTANGNISVKIYYI